MEVFKPLAQFLSNLGKQHESELLLLDCTSEKAIIKAAQLIACVNLIGTLRNLPSMIGIIKKQQEERDEYIRKQKEVAKDPLGEGV